MDVLGYIALGLKTSIQPANLLYCFTGALIGTLIGVLPGIGPVATISILLPITMKISPTAAVIMLAGIYYGAQYGGSTTAILVNIPGEATTIATCLDGYQMAKQGRAGPALGMAAIGSFIAGTFGLIGLTLLANTFSEAALKFGPAEYCSLMIFAFVVLSYLAQGSLIKAFIMGVLGLILNLVGMDTMTGQLRFTFGVLSLSDGIGLAPFAMGVFGIAEVLVNVEQTLKAEVVQTRVRQLLPSLNDFLRSKWSICRGTVIGFFLGILPGAGPAIAPFLSYSAEKKLSKHPEQFGKGMIEGVAGPEAANNAAAQASFIPLLTLGVPPNATMAIFFGALTIYGLHPGPLLMTDHPDFFWAVVMSMYFGNIMLLILNLPLIPLWVQVLRLHYSILFPLILLFCLIGAYSINYNVFDIFVMIVFGIVGYLMRKFEYEGAPLIMGFVLGDLLEVNLRRALVVSDGSFSIFITRPISAVILSCALILIVLRLRSVVKSSKS